MNRAIPKPYLQLSGRTILEHTLRQFLPLDGLQQVVVATPEDYLETAEDILRKTLPGTINGKCLVGGRERQDSIYKALTQVAEVDLVIVHDAVRPFVKLSHIENCCKAASDIGAAVLGVPANDTIKRVDDRQLIVETPNRKVLWQAQTPQVFRRELILRGYEKARTDNFAGTDDASLVERLDQEVKIVHGDRSNFKITYPLDLELAQLLIKKKKA